MITYTSKDSFLSIPKGLGNFSTGSGGGGGEDLGPLSGSVIELSATTENLASSVGSINTNVEALSGSVETLTSDLGDLSGTTDTIGDAVADLLLDVDNIDGRVSGNTDNIAALSAATQTMEGSITAVTSSVDSLSGAVTSLTEGVESVSASTSANTAQIEALSGSVESLSAATVNGLSGANEAASSAYTRADDAYTLASQKQDAISAGNGIEISGATVSVKIGEGLAFSGDTLVTSGLQKEALILDVVKIENMSYSNREALWDEAYGAIVSGRRVYARGIVAGATTYTALLPLERYCPETDPSGHLGGFLFFTVKSKDANKYMSYNFSSAGNTSGVDNSGRLTLTDIYSLPDASANKLGGVKIGSGVTLDSNTRLSVKYGSGLAMSGDTLVAEGGGGIEKVDELPDSAEEGDVVWLNGQTGITGYTVTCNGDNWASWPWELDRNYFNINDSAISIRGSKRIGKWTKTNELFEWWSDFQGLLMRARRNSTDGGPVYDFIDPTGQYTITAGSDAASITTNSFDFRGSLYVYSGGKWYRKAEREVLISETGTTVADLVRSIWCDIEDADYDDLVIRYAPNGKDLREFKIYMSAFYGMDIQCSDDRETGDGWGRLNVRNFRMGIDGSIQDLVGEKWIVSEDQIQHPSQHSIQITSTGSFSNPDELGAFSSEQTFRIWFRYNGANGTDWGMAPLKYIWRRIESINGEDKLVYHWAIENLFINGTAYKGSWHSVEWEWSNYVTDSWTTM